MFEGEHGELILALLPLAFCLFLATFLGFNEMMGRVYRIPRKAGMILLGLTLLAGIPLGVMYFFYEPQDCLGCQPGPFLNDHCAHSPRSAKGMKVKLISYASGRALPLADVSEPLNRRYAKRHGFEYHMYRDTCVPRIRHLQWTKIALLYQELQAEDAPRWVIFHDADAVFVSQRYNVYTEFLERLPSKVVLVVPEDVGGHRPINTGLMFVRSGPQAKHLLRLIWDNGRSLRLLRRWFHEQGTLTQLVAMDETVRKQVLVLGHGDKDEVRVKMYADGSLPSRTFPTQPFAWRIGDQVAHCIGPKEGGTDKMKALKELAAYIDLQHD